MFINVRLFPVDQQLQNFDLLFRIKLIHSTLKKFKQPLSCFCGSD